MNQKESTEEEIKKEEISINVFQNTLAEGKRKVRNEKVFSSMRLLMNVLNEMKRPPCHSLFCQHQ